MGVEGNSRKYSETPADIAALFNNYFTSIFTNDPNTSIDPSTIDDNISLLEDVVLTPDDVVNVLRTLDNENAHGPDGIPARLQTETASQIASSLCQLLPAWYHLIGNSLMLFLLIKKETRNLWKIIDLYLCSLWFRTFWNAVSSILLKIVYIFYRINSC